VNESRTVPNESNLASLVHADRADREVQKRVGAKTRRFVQDQFSIDMLEDFVLDMFEVVLVRENESWTP